MSFSEQQLREIRGRVDLVELIGRTVELKQTGSRLQGLCPFHGEKTPSFDVDRERGTFKCFGCQEQGDCFAFVMKLEAVHFPEAVRRCAEFAGVELEEQRTSGAGGSTQGGNRRASSSRPPSRPHPGREPRDPKAKVENIGSAKGAKIVQTYDYTDTRGNLLYQVCRTEPKSFRQRRPHPAKEGVWIWKMLAHTTPDGVEMPEQETILYRAPELKAALLAGDPIWICEGEKDADNVRAETQVATCCSGGAGKWRDDLSRPFAGFRGTVRIVRDRDEPGEAHAEQVLASLADVVDPEAKLQIWEPATGKDVSDHLGAGLSLDELVQVYPLPENLVDTDPKRFKQIMLRRALDVPEIRLQPTRHVDFKARPQPTYRCGLAGLETPISWQGNTVIVGDASTGKSYVTMGTGIDNAHDGWDVYYVACEMNETTIRDRAARAEASRRLGVNDWQSGQRRNEAINAAQHVVLPDTFVVLDLPIGTQIQDLLEFLVENVTDRPTMIIMDSISSFIGNSGMAAEARSNDPWGMGALLELQRWISGVARLTHGQVAFVLISEVNAEGKSKGRVLEYRCDCAIVLKLSEEENDESVRVHCTKNWHGPKGRLGDYAIRWELGRLVKVPTT